MQLCSSLNILWHCLSLGLEWKLTFSSPVSTAEIPHAVGQLTPRTTMKSLQDTVTIPRAATKTWSSPKQRFLLKKKKYIYIYTPWSQFTFYDSKYSFCKRRQKFPAYTVLILITRRKHFYYGGNTFLPTWHKLKNSSRDGNTSLRPYHPERVQSCLISEAKQGRAWLVLGWQMGIPDNLTCLLRNLYAGQEATVRTGHGTTDWFQIRKGVSQGCILSPRLFNFYAEYIMWNAGLDDAQAGIKIAGRHINNLRYADDTTFMAES